MRFGLALWACIAFVFLVLAGLEALILWWNRKRRR
jgi:uncharacterized membrane protein